MIGNGKGGSFFTPEGGIARRYINKTGAPSVKGYTVETHATIDNAVDLIGIDDPDPIGVIYEDGIPDGEEVTIVYSGVAEVYFVGTVLNNTFARVTVAADVGAAAGQAIAEAVPTAPFATDKHFQEIGHPIEARTGAGLAKVNLHFN